jgi:6,7-dimethyl-8-ribityllumazine synthase
VIKSIHKLILSSNRREFDALVEFFSAIGVAPGEAWRGEHSSGAKLQAPEAGVEIGMGDGFPDADLVLECDSADALYEMLQRRAGITLGEIADTSWGARMFVAGLPASAGRVAVFSYKEPRGQDNSPKLDARGLRFAVVVSRFNSFITERLLSGALDALHRLGAAPGSIEVVWVPGAFEIPGAARALADSGKFDALLCLGCLLRGDTLHYEVIANEVARGIGQSAQETGVPHAFGVLTCDTLEQAIDRAGLKSGNKGFEAAMAAVEMARTRKPAAASGASPETRGARSSGGGKRSRSARPAGRKKSGR